MGTHRKMPSCFLGAGVLLVVTDVVLLLSMLARPPQDEGVPGAGIATFFHVGSAIALICIGCCAARHAHMDEPAKVIQEPVHG